VLLDRCSLDALPLWHAEGRSLSPGQVSPSPAPSRSLAPWVKAHTKLPILHICIWQLATEMEITVRCGYAASIGSLVWALTKQESDWEGV